MGWRSWPERWAGDGGGGEREGRRSRCCRCTGPNIPSKSENSARKEKRSARFKVSLFERAAPVLALEEEDVEFLLFPLDSKLSTKCSWPFPGFDIYESISFVISVKKGLSTLLETVEGKMNIDRWRVKKIKVSCVIINLDIFWKDVLVLFIYHLHIIHVLFHEWNTLKGQSSGNKFRGTLIRVNVDRFIRIILNQIQDPY